jgi:hypothetical protein
MLDAIVMALALGVSATTAAPADEVTARSDAEALRDEARRRFDEGHFAEAAQLLEELYALDPRPEYLYSRGQAPTSTTRSAGSNAAASTSAPRRRPSLRRPSSIRHPSSIRPLSRSAGGIAIRSAACCSDSASPASPRAQASWVDRSRWRESTATKPRRITSIASAASIASPPPAGRCSASARPSSWAR